jgi:hypothetical protein
VVTVGKRYRYDTQADLDDLHWAMLEPNLLQYQANLRDMAMMRGAAEHVASCGFCAEVRRLRAGKR